MGYHLLKLSCKLSNIGKFFNILTWSWLNRKCTLQLKILCFQSIKILINFGFHPKSLMKHAFLLLDTTPSQLIRVCLKLCNLLTYIVISFVQFIIKLGRPFTKNSQNRGMIDSKLPLFHLFLGESSHLRRDLLTYCI